MKDGFAMHVRPYWMAGLAALAAIPAQASPPRLALDLRGLESTAVSYHPGRWAVAPGRQMEPPLRVMEGNRRRNSYEPAYAPRSDAFRAMADLHPFGNGFRLSLGAREEQRGRLLHGAGNWVDIDSNSFAPVVTAGYVGRIGRHLALGVDAGLTARNTIGRRRGMVIMPSDMLQPAVRGGYQPIVDVSLAYRF